MELTLHLRQLLYNHECVIVPGLGGFLCSYKKFEFNTQAGLLIPARRTVVFNQNLNNNDGLLANHLTQKLNIGFTAALENINAWVSNLHYTLQQGQTVNLEGVGSLTLNEEKKLVFVPMPDANFLAETYGLGIVKLGKTDAPKAEQPVAKPAIVDPPLLIQTNKTKAEIKPSEESQPVSRSTTEAAPTIPPQRQARKKVSFLRRVFILFIVLMVISALVLLQDFMYHANINKGSLFSPEAAYQQPTETKPENTANTGAQDTENESTAKQSAESLKKDTDTQPAVETSTAITSQTDSVFYIIAGAFRSEKNAEAYVDDLDKKGYEPQIINIQGSSLYRVGYRQYATRSEAEARLDDVRVKEQNHAAWVLAVKK